MSEVRFSIVIPTYNRSNVVGKAITSVLQQNYQNWELIIVDDSKQSQIDAIESMSDKRITYLFRGEKFGVGSARNAGAKSATGDYLVFLDDDDIITTDYLRDFNNYFNSLNAPVDICYCGMKVMDTSGAKEVLPSARLIEGKDKAGIVLAGAWTMKTEFFHMIEGYDNRFLFGENAELLLRARERKPATGFIDKLNFIRYLTEDGASKNLLNVIDSNKLMLEKHKSFFDSRKNVKIRYTQVIGVSLMRLGKGKEARSFLWKAFLLNPFRIKLLLSYVLTYSQRLTKYFYVS